MADELLETDDEEYGWALTRRAALLVAILAAFLSIVSFLNDDAGNGTLLSQSQANNEWNRYNTRTLMRHVDTDIAGMLRALAVGDNRAAELRTEAGRLDRRVAAEHPAALQRLASQAQENERQRDKSERAGRAYSFAQTGLEIAVILGSMSVFMRLAPLLWASGVVGLVSVLLGLVGLFGGTLPF